MGPHRLRKSPAPVRSTFQGLKSLRGDDPRTSPYRAREVLMDPRVPRDERRLMKERRRDEQTVERIAGPGEGHCQRNQRFQGVVRQDRSIVGRERAQDLIRLCLELAHLLEEAHLQANQRGDEEQRLLQDLPGAGPEDLGSPLPEENDGVSVQKRLHDSGFQSHEVAMSSSGVQLRASRRGRSASRSRAPPEGTIINIRGPRVTGWGIPVSSTSSNTL